MREDWRAHLSDGHMLASILPDWVPSPSSIMYELDSQAPTLDFEWYADQKNLIVIFVSGDRRVSYAGMIDGKSSSGRTSQAGVISPECMTLLRGIVDKIRAAEGKSGGE